MKKQPNGKAAGCQKHRIARFNTSVSFAILAMASAAVLTGATPMASAQEANAGSEDLEAITVTARFTDEAIEDVPFTVNALQGEDIEQERLPTLEEALAQTPGVDILSYGMNYFGFVRIRGVGSLGQAGLDDNSVVIHMDGMPLSMVNATTEMMDIESVEVLKGPQGTLLGRNSEGGAVNIRSKRPTQHFEAYLGGEIGTEKQRMVKVLSVGLSMI